jgi:hypothetical protein
VPLPQFFTSLPVQNPLHYQILNRQWHTGSDASLLLLLVLHPALIGLKKTKKKRNPATPRMLAVLVHKPYKKQFIHHKLRGIHTRNSTTTAVHPRNNSYITEKRGGIQHITSLIHKSICTSEIGIPQIDSFARKDKLGFHKLTHTTYTEARGEGRPGGRSDQGASAPSCSPAPGTRRSRRVDLR